MIEQLIFEFKKIITGRAQRLSTTIFEKKLLHAQPLHPTPNRGERIDDSEHRHSGVLRTSA